MKYCVYKVSKLNRKFNEKNNKKKIFNFIIVISILLLINLIEVSANSLTLESLVNQLKNSEMYNYYIDSGWKVQVSEDNNSLKIITTVPHEEQSKDVETILYYDKATDILSYEYNGKTDPSDEIFMQMGCDGVWIGQILYIIAENNGITIESNDDLSTDLTMEQNGIKIETINIENDGVKMTSYKSMKVKLNGLKLNTTSEEEKNNPNINDNENVENPKTGDFILITALLFIFIIAIFTINIINKKNLIRKI